MRPKSYDYYTKTKKEATATQTLCYFSKTIFFFFGQSHNYYRRKNLDIRQENTKNPEIKFTFLPLSTVFPSLKQKLNTNQI